jgi:hypothetical protein
VNPVFASDPSVNPTGIAFGDPIPNSFPKSDPYCYQAPARGQGNSIVPPLLCGTDWMPYNRGFAEGARYARSGNDVAKIVDNPFAQTSSDVWKRDAPLPSGSRTMLAITDTPSATRFGLQMARLSRAGDNGADRRFIAPTASSLAAGVEAMESRTEPQVLESDPTADAPDAYPLTMLTYAAIKPLSLDEDARLDYAAFLDFVSDQGQSPGFDFGDLPPGYAPLPTALRVQGAVAAVLVAEGELIEPEPPTTTPSTTVAAPTTSAPTPNSVASNGPGTQSTTGGSTGLPAVGTSRPTSNNGGSNNSGSNNSGSGATSDTESSTTTEVPTSEVPVDTDVPQTTVVDQAVPSTAPASPALTPGLDLAGSRFAVVAIGVAAIAAALAALEITKRTRRATEEVSVVQGVAEGDPDVVELFISEVTVDA